MSNERKRLSAVIYDTLQLLDRECVKIELEKRQLKKEIDEIYERKLYSRRKLEEENTKMKQLLKDINQMSAYQVLDHLFIINRTLKEMGEVE